MQKEMKLPRQNSKKKLKETVEALQKEHPEAVFEVWSGDEHRLGLQPIKRRMWVKRGSRPTSTVHQRYEWTYLYGFVCPQNGKTFWLILPTVTIAWFNRALQELAKDQGVGKDKRIILVIDKAGFHDSPEVIVPEGIHIIFLPPYSPELQPSERLWPLANEGVANRYFKTIEELEEKLAQRVNMLSTLTTLIN